jgi:hypothetical protein
MVCFLQHFASLLEALTVSPDWTLLDLPLIDDDPSRLNPVPAYEQDEFVFELS